MTSSYLEEAENQELFRQKQRSNASDIFHTSGSSGSNPIKLAQILATFDFVMDLLGWQDKPLANLTTFLTQYQASIDTKYHNDFKDVLVAEEIERKRSERKGLSILNQQ